MRRLGPSLAALGIVAGAMLSVQAVLAAGAVVLLSRGAAAEKALREQLVATEARLAALEKHLDDTDVRLQRVPRDWPTGWRKPWRTNSRGARGQGPARRRPRPGYPEPDGSPAEETRPMNLWRMAKARAEDGRPVRVGLIGAGKFGSMFLAQVPTIPGLEVAVIADLDPERARAACRTVGWDEGGIGRTRFVASGREACEDEASRCVIEATGSPAAGIAHALAAIDAGKHIVMVNVEADVLAGPLLAARARRARRRLLDGLRRPAGAGLPSWSTGRARPASRVAAAGKGTKYLPAYHAVTPDEVWRHYGLTRRAGAPPRA